ncbi:MAG: substrate-binding domain-containing protein [Acetobacteraceae bacterium]
MTIGHALSFRIPGRGEEPGCRPSRARGWTGRTGLAACFGLALTAAAAASDVVVFTDRDLGEGAAAAVAPLRTQGRAVEADVRAVDAACTTTPGNRVRLAVVPRTPTQAEIDVCTGGIGADAVVIPIGHQALALATPANGPVFSVASADLFRALGANAAGTPPATWSSLGAGYPAALISVLAAPAGSMARQVFEAQMETGCQAMVPAASLPFDRAGRLAFCGALRAGPSVKQRQAGIQPVADWAKTAGPGAIALVSVTELPALDGVVNPLLIDNVLPSAANISDGRYPARRAVNLVIVLPRFADAYRRDAARSAVFELTSEAMIGPGGALTRAGLIALPPAQRLEARTKAVAFIE